MEGKPNACLKRGVPGLQTGHPICAGTGPALKYLLTSAGLAWPGLAWPGLRPSVRGAPGLGLGDGGLELPGEPRTSGPQGLLQGGVHRVGVRAAVGAPSYWLFADVVEPHRVPLVRLPEAARPVSPVVALGRVPLHGVSARPERTSLRPRRRLARRRPFLRPHALGWQQHRSWRARPWLGVAAVLAASLTWALALMGDFTPGRP